MDDQDALLSTDVELEDDADGFDYLPVEIAITTSKGYRQLRDVESDDESEEDSDYTVLTSLDDDMSDESDDSIGISMLKNKALGYRLLRDDDTSDEVCYAESCDGEEFYLTDEERQISDDEFYDAEGFSEEFFDWNDAECDPAPFSDSDIQDMAGFF